MKSVLAVALLVVVGSVAYSQSQPDPLQPSPLQPLPEGAAQPLPEGAAVTHPQRWEYKVTPSTAPGGEDPSAILEQRLNEVAKEGWELFHVGEQVFIFKRSTECCGEMFVPL